MTTHIKILGKVDMKAFETPPVFSDKERSNYFSLPEWAEKFVKTLRTWQSLYAKNLVQLKLFE